MASSRPAEQAAGSGRAHSAAVVETYRRMLVGSGVTGRRITIRPGVTGYVLAAGEGPPVLHLHGSNTSSLSHLPLLERSVGLHSVAVDRPGLGLSDPIPVPRASFRVAAVDFVGSVLDALGWPTAAIAGGSMGSVWALWFAQAHPERVSRLVMMGSAPLLPGTRPPAAFRAITTPVLGDLLIRIAKPDAAAIVRRMASVGESDTIVAHPDLLSSLVEGAHDPVAAAANLAELRAVISVRGFRSSMLIRADELRRLQVPTLLIWGDRDPIGSVEVARDVAALMPNARLEVLAAGHVPWLRHPDRLTELLCDFVLRG